MNTQLQSARFFMGSNTADGFYSYFEDLQNPAHGDHLVLLKGGPGTGKSTLMKRLAADYAGFSEQIHCASDPDSLDAVIFPAEHQIFVDATPPHALEPKHPLVVEELLDLAAKADIPAIQAKREEIVTLTGIISNYHRRFCSLLKSANLLYDNNRALLTPYLNHEKLEKQTRRLMDRGFRRAAEGTESRRLLSAFTPKGLVRFSETVPLFCHNVLILHDEPRACAPLMLAMLRQHLLERGIAFYSCYSPYCAHSELEALLVPSISFGMVTATKALPYTYDGKMMHTTRFIDPEIFRLKKQRLSFCRKTAEALLEEGVDSLKKAKEAHDVLEALYRPHMDFSLANDAFDRFREKVSISF